MNNEVDHYDVQTAQETAERNARYYTDRAVHEAVTELRRELNETVEALQRTLASRTDHLV